MHQCLRQAFEVLDDATEAVPVRGDDQVLAFLQLGCDGLVPVRQGPFNRQLERLAVWELALWDVAVPRVFLDRLVVRVVLVHGKGWHIVGPAPNLDLVLPVLVRCFSLVEAREAAVVPLVQAPRFVERDLALEPCSRAGGTMEGAGQYTEVAASTASELLEILTGLPLHSKRAVGELLEKRTTRRESRSGKRLRAEFVEDDFTRRIGTLQHGRVRLVEPVPALFESFGTGRSLFLAGFRQRGVKPATELVECVPFALSVSHLER